MDSSRPLRRAVVVAAALLVPAFLVYGPHSTPSEPALVSARPGIEWTRFGEAAPATLYVDASSLEREGNIVRIVELQDLKAADPDGVRSRSYLNEYDCRHRMHRIGQVTSHAGAMLEGQRLFSVAEMGYWRQIPGDGLFRQAFRHHCGAATPTAAEAAASATASAAASMEPGLPAR